MKTEERKTFLKNALTNSFVDDYKAYKNTMIFINNDLKECDIDFQYTYDEFCISFLNESLNSLDEIDIFTISQNDKFFLNFLNFNLYNLHSMINKKIKELGYNDDYFYIRSNEKNQKYLEN